MSGLKIGLTGGIGSGKSAASSYLRSLGVPVFDADRVAREVVEPGSPAITEITARFGQAVLLADQSLDRARLRRIVFDDPEQRIWLESLLHPLINRRLEELQSKESFPYSILESPILFEANQRRLVERVLVIDARKDIQRARASMRDGVSPEDVEKIMAAQLSREERLKLADDVVENNGTLAELATALEELHHKYLRLAEAKNTRGN